MIPAVTLGVAYLVALGAFGARLAWDLRRLRGLDRTSVERLAPRLAPGAVLVEVTVAGPPGRWVQLGLGEDATFTHVLVSPGFILRTATGEALRVDAGTSVRFLGEAFRHDGFVEVCAGTPLRAAIGATAGHGAGAGRTTDARLVPVGDSLLLGEPGPHALGLCERVLHRRGLAAVALAGSLPVLLAAASAARGTTCALTTSALTIVALLPTVALAVLALTPLDGRGGDLRHPACSRPYTAAPRYRRRRHR
jgi:hypothetical protein